MSKNFELMQELLKEADTERAASPTPHPTPFLFPPTGLAGMSRRQVQGFDRVAREECLKLAHRVFLAQPPKYRVIVFAGIDEGNGCSRICVETARILAANTSSPVCIVDGNFRTPSLPDFFGVQNHCGLLNSLVEEGEVRKFAKQLKPSNLWLLSAGALLPESPSLLNSERSRLRFNELRSEFSYTLIDAPALNHYSDALALARNADGVVVVLHANSTRREAAVKSINSLREAQIEVVGAVLNRRTFPIPNFLYRRL
jgi:Mrp family chromosome partitioning ATPase